MASWLRKYHKWLSLLLGVQMLLWIISGAYMVWMDLDFIHGDHLVKPQEQQMPAAGEIGVTLSELLVRYPETSSSTLLPVTGRAVYQLKQPGGVVIIDAGTGRELSIISEQQARRLASEIYALDGEIASARLIERDPPSELGSRPLPVWQVNFNDFGNSSLYLSAHTGALLTKRHDFWRLFDVMWMLHIMDYEERSDVHNALLTWFGLFGLLTALTGIGLTYLRFTPAR